MRPPRTSALLATTLLVVAGCAGTDGAAEPGDDERITIVADVYPTAYAAEQVGGDRVEVILLTSPGVEPHDLELSPAQIAQITEADLVAYVPGLIPAVEEAAAQSAPDRSVDVTAGIAPLDGDAQQGSAGDPHVWMDPTNMAAMGATIASALTERGLGSDWATQELDAAMSDLDDEFSTGLADCAVTPLVVSHEAFGYLADAYGFDQHGISGLSPDAEPSPAKLAEITSLVESEGVTTIYFEALASPAAAETIAAETGATTAMLDPIEGSTDGQPYDAIMRQNLATLITGQGCT